MTAPRVRFAPSPTGWLHVGSARTALFNWLYARHTGGTLILRIEDTDTERGREEWVQGIIDSLAWLGLDADEGPYRQSERGGLYQAAIDALWSAGALYACECTREEVDARTKGNARPGYDGFCRERGLEREGRALRFRIPTGGATVVRDVIRGEVSFPHEAMEDFVCVRSSGDPLFVLANVVDDRDMAITHAIRGEDLLPSAPKNVLLWEALDQTGQPVPICAFAHLPMLVDERRQKLSKRRETGAIEAYREDGYLDDAMRNYLALLGWSPAGDQEKAGDDVLIAQFDLADVHHAPAFFDIQKLRHLNGEYLRELPVTTFIAQCAPWLTPDHSSWQPGDHRPPWPPDRYDPAVFEQMAALVQERVTTLAEVPGMVDFFFLADPVVDEASWEKAMVKEDAAVDLLEGAVAAYETCPWEAAALHGATEALGQTLGRKLGKAQAPIRVAVTGRSVGPPLFESLHVLGRDEVLRRLRAALAKVVEPA